PVLQGQLAGLSIEEMALTRLGIARHTDDHEILIGRHRSDAHLTPRKLLLKKVVVGLPLLALPVDARPLILVDRRDQLTRLVRK
ncbi:MAG: hypothetical protein ACK56F_00555, partial [bacterium]